MMKYDDYIVIAQRKDGSFFSDTVTSDTPKSDFKEIYRHGQPYKIIEALPVPTAALGKIAFDKLNKIETLKTRNDDSLDFHEISVWNLRAALKEAYAQGYKDALANQYQKDAKPNGTQGVTT